MAGAVTSALPLASTTAYWYLTRSTGIVAMVLLSAAVALGIIDVKRFSNPRWPRFVVDALHRNVSLLAMAFLGVHIITSVLDSFAPIGLVDAVIPFAGTYRPFWLGLGAVSFDLLVAVVATSLMRQRLGYASWRAVHWLTYAAWPVALLHGFGTGSDVRFTWMLAISVVCVLAVLAAVAVRVLAGRAESARVRGAALGGAGAFSLFLLVWMPSGPLGSEWARRSGTPPSLLAHGSSTAHSHGGK
jgi:sulfoxide reductase heme-binding subunit YedZ